MNRVEQLKIIQMEALSLYITKNKDYSDTFTKYGLVNMLMQIETKLQQCISISKTGIHLVSDIGLKDTLLELHNYAALALHTGSTDRVEHFKGIQLEALTLFIKKNADYGDAFAKYGLVGVLMRIEDKMQRGISISNSGINLVLDEGLMDTLLDLHNYAAMALMLL